MISRRKFIKACFAAAGIAAFGSCGSRSWASPRAEGGAANVPEHGGAYRPRYLTLAASGELERREQELWKKMDSCSLCPRMCGTNRMAGRKGICSSDHTFRVASATPHHGEERPLVGRNGSGTIFFSNCNLLCIFCQNWRIAHRGEGRQTSHAQLADMMISLQNRGCHNINLVTPSHLSPHIVTALRLAIDRGLNVPLLYNSSGYETLEVMQLLDGVVDIYLPDFKFQDSEIAIPFLQGAQNYAEYAAVAIKEMHRQVGTLTQADGIANRGLLIRHLVLPENLAGTDVFSRWVASELGADTHLNIMSQYSPQFRANEFPPLNRRITQREFEQAMRWARQAGLRNFH
ncbi:MAG: twin-arginine translocation signal domain-containing protein [Spirochaetes bacterium]|nr:twin-arginine translocation signal domain-containing protein [Spirochaetota bacterium]